MTKITFRKKDGKWRSVESRDHADYAEYGEDIVCAGISAVLITLENGLTAAAGISNVKSKVCEGFLSLELPENMNASDEEKAQLLFQAVYLSLMNMTHSYPEHVKVRTKED